MAERKPTGNVMSVSWTVNGLVAFWLFIRGFNGSSVTLQLDILLVVNVLLGLGLGWTLRRLQLEMLLISISPMLFIAVLLAFGSLENRQYLSAIELAFAPLLLQGVPWGIAVFARRLVSRTT